MPKLFAGLFVLLLLSPLLVSSACGSERLPGRRRYCSINQSLDFLGDGGSAFLWIMVAVLALAALGHALSGDDDPGSD